MHMNHFISIKTKSKFIKRKEFKHQMHKNLWIFISDKGINFKSIFGCINYKNQY